MATVGKLIPCQVVWLILYLRWQYELKLKQVPIPGAFDPT